MKGESLDPFIDLGPGVNLTISDYGGYEEHSRYWVWLETIHGGDGLIYTGATLAEACRKFAAKEGGVDHP